MRVKEFFTVLADGIYQGLFWDMLNKGTTPPSAPTDMDWLNPTIAAHLDTAYYYNSGEKTVDPAIEDLLKNRRAIASVILKSRFRHNWTHLYNVYNVEYEPIENYSMVEIETPNITHKKTITDNTDIVKRATFNGTPTTVEEVTRPSVEDTTETGTRQLTRRGNIGVTTSQQMIESEVKLWGKNFDFFREVFTTLDEIITIPIY